VASRRSPSAIATTGNSYGVQASFQFSPGLILLVGPVTLMRFWKMDLAEASTGDNAEIWNYGLALPDFGKEGNLLGLVAGVPPRAGRNDFGAARRDDDTSIHLLPPTS